MILSTNSIIFVIYDTLCFAFSSSDSCLEFWGWLSDTMSFMLLDAAYFCVLIFLSFFQWDAVMFLGNCLFLLSLAFKLY